MDVPLEAAPLPDAQGPQRIVCAGRIERFKGQDTLVKAFVRIAHRHPQAELLLLGPDQWSPHARFEQLVNAWAPDGSVRRRIRMEGRVPLDEVLQTLNSAAVSVISSSGFESFSFSTLEAMAAARPIVGSYVGAIPELLDQGRCGLLASPGNVQQFADALDRLLSDRELCQRLSMAAHQRALRQYDTAAVLPAVIAAYQKARRRFYRFGPAEPAQPGYALQCA
jgi:glycosyltransferase involved in cell wall biosynthesis